MSSQDHHDPETDLRKRIVSQIQATGRSRQKTINPEELQALKTAASRLEQLLSEATDADREALKSAAARLEKFLAEISKGKDITPGLKRRGDEPRKKD